MKTLYLRFNTSQIILLLLLFLFLFTGRLSLAKTEKLNELASEIPRVLIQHDIHQLGNLNLDKLVEQINTEVRWMVLPDFSVGAGSHGSSRVGSSCHIEEKGVIVNEPHLQQLHDRFLAQGLLLHESLCALGWVDDNYALSSTMGVLYMLIKGNEQDSEKWANATAFIYNADFQWVLNKFINRREFSPRFLIQKEHGITADAGTVTGVGGGGDMFGWGLKTLIFKNFVSIHNICNRYPNQNRVAYPGIDSKNTGFDLQINCQETRFYSWWYFVLNLNIESAKMHHASLARNYIADMPWVGAYVIEPIAATTNSPFKNDITISLDNLRWLVIDTKLWDGAASLFFLELLAHHYKLVTNVILPEPQSLIYQGKAEFIDSMMKIYSRSGLKRCKQIVESYPTEISLALTSLSKEVYFAKLLRLTDEELSLPPYCVFWVN